MATLSTHIPQEITEVKEKIIGGMTLRQLAAVAVALLTGGATFYLCFVLFGMTAKQSSYFIMAAAAIPGAFGFLHPQNMDLEQYLAMRYTHWKRTKPIPYKTSTRGDTPNEPVHAQRAKKNEPEYTCPYYRYSRRRERRIIRETRKHIRRNRREIRKAQKAFRKLHQTDRHPEKH